MKNKDTAFFGHPIGLSTLFFTEMWERFSYYGIRALLILYMTASSAQGGLGLSVAQAGAIYGLFTASAYIFALPGGWLADRFLGQQKSVVIGGLLIALGNFLMMTPSEGVLVASLLVIALGTGFLKTSCTTTVGFLYQQADVRRDAGFSIYYVGINLGAFIAPLICGYVGQRIAYRYAFALAGVCMLAGVGQFLVTRRLLGGAGEKPVVQATAQDKRTLWMGLAGLAVVVLAVVLLQVPMEKVADAFAAVLTILVTATFAWLLSSKDFSKPEKSRIIVVLVLFIASVVFWSIFEQAGSTLNLFADRSTDNRLFGWEFPSSFFQSLNSLYIIFGMAGFFAWLWVKLGDKNPSVVTKFSFGLFGAGAGFVIMMLAAQAAGAGKVSIWWLAACYFVHTAGELCLSPVGLSAMSKLAPQRVAGFMMGVWFLSISAGNFMGGYLAQFYEKLPLEQLFGYVGGFGLLMGVLMLVISKPVTRLMGGIR